MRQAIRCSKRAPTPAKIDDSILDDRQLYLCPDKVLTVCVSIKIELLLSIKKGICEIIKCEHASLHIWQAAMRVKVGLTDRQRERETHSKGKKRLGAIIPGSVLAAAVLPFCFFCNFNMFFCTSCFAAISAYRLLMSSNFDKLLNTFCPFLAICFPLFLLPSQFPSRRIYTKYSRLCWCARVSLLRANYNCWSAVDLCIDKRQPHIFVLVAIKNLQT